MSRFANSALLGGGVRARVWIREQRKIKRRSKALPKLLMVNLDITRSLLYSWVRVRRRVFSRPFCLLHRLCMGSPAALHGLPYYTWWSSSMYSPTRLRNVLASSSSTSDLQKSSNFKSVTEKMLFRLMCCRQNGTDQTTYVLCGHMISIYTRTMCSLVPRLEYVHAQYCVPQNTTSSLHVCVCCEGGVSEKLSHAVCSLII